MQLTFQFRHPLLDLRNTCEADLDYVLQTERQAENARFVDQWSKDTHRNAFVHPDQAHCILQTPAHAHSVGYLIMTGLAEEHISLYLKRLVITEKGHGYGRAALQQVKLLAFQQLGYHRLWLDVVADNQHAIHLYLSEGFLHEGILRENGRYQGKYQSHAIMSILEAEYNRGTSITTV